MDECKPLDSGSIEYAEFREIMREKMGERNPVGRCRLNLSHPRLKRLELIS